MEQAYEELYREFLQLRSLCLKQAALLHHLTEALEQKKAADPAPNADPRAPLAVSTLYMQKKWGPTSEECAQAMARLLPSAGQTKAGTTAAGDGCTADLIAGGMDRLQLSSAQTLRVATMGPLASSGLTREPPPPHGPGDTLRPEQHLREVFQKAMGGINDFDAADATTRRMKLWKFSSFMDSEMLSQAGGLMMSEVALQSQVCEFCQAVFPGNTTTRGEFLRHLTAHII